MKLHFVRSVALAALFLTAAGCSSKVNLPESVRGIWKQQSGQNMLLRLEQNGERGDASYSQGGSSSGGDGFFGPLQLKQDSGTQWEFQIAPIEIVNGNNTNITSPPQSTRDMEYVIDQNGRHLVRGYTAMSKEGKVTLRLDGEKLIARGLWAQIEVQRWDAQGKPSEEKITPLETVFLRLTASTKLVDKVQVSGVLHRADGSPAAGVKLLLVAMTGSEENPNFSQKTDGLGKRADPSAETDSAGKFTFTVDHGYLGDVRTIDASDRFVLAIPDAKDNRSAQLLKSRGKAVITRIDGTQSEINLGEIVQ